MKKGKKMLFVYNPKAGKAMIRNKLVDILDIFAANDYEVTICPTRRHDDATEIITNRGEDYDLVVCCGGDGTLGETVKGMIASEIRTPIGYIPAGSTNDFAASLSIPTDMTKAANIIVNGKPFTCDIGDFNGEMFIYVAAFGIFSEISYSTGQQVKNALGHSAYILSGGKSIFNAKPQHVRVMSDDINIEDDFIYGMVSNSDRVGGFKGIMGKDVNLSDGQLEVTLIKSPKSPQDLNKILFALIDKTLDTDLIYSFHTTDVTFECEEGIRWALDGEDGGSHTFTRIRAIKGAIDIVIDNSAEESKLTGTTVGEIGEAMSAESETTGSESEAVESESEAAESES